MRCKHCNAELTDIAIFCNVCGRSTKSIGDVPVCESCGEASSEGAVFCQHCGNKLKKETAENNQVQERQVPVSCPRCREIPPMKALFCANCGYRLPNAQTVPMQQGIPVAPQQGIPIVPQYNIPVALQQDTPVILQQGDAIPAQPADPLPEAVQPEAEPVQMVTGDERLEAAEEPQEYPEPQQPQVPLYGVPYSFPNRCAFCGEFLSPHARYCPACKREVQSKQTIPAYSSPPPPSQQAFPPSIYGPQPAAGYYTPPKPQRPRTAVERWGRKKDKSKPDLKPSKEMKWLGVVSIASFLILLVLGAIVVIMPKSKNISSPKDYSTPLQLISTFIDRIDKFRYENADFFWEDAISEYDNYTSQGYWMNYLSNDTEADGEHYATKYVLLIAPESGNGTALFVDEGLTYYYADLNSDQIAKLKQLRSRDILWHVLKNSVDPSRCDINGLHFKEFDKLSDAID